ncbi:glycosyltransferase family 2 protein [Phaeodactylibacter xiamenensis]|uniref:glycosyltransferase family 2 protein n=1 Tax=Phaeodactylibacter xiamenensis TaxID=1524460 RepID=UPI0024A7ABE1|nr:glycosyltransferase family 2 protein [Phaeodactylibacter xiamenensis]
MKPIKISIVIPNYNCASLIERCLDSVFDQIGNFDLEVVLIDDGSTDNSLELLKSYSKQLIVLEQKNQGPAAARNAGIEIATGKYLAFLDADDYWESTFLQETVSFLEENENAIAVSVGQVHKIPGKPNTISPNILSSKLNKFKTSIIINNFYSFWVKNNHVCTGSVLTLTEIAKATGGQRTDLRITEDIEFWLYLATFGDWGFIPKVLITTDGGLSVKANGYYKKNLKRWRNAPTIEYWEKRILSRIDKELYTDYKLARGKVAKMMVYSFIQSFRIKLARSTVKKYIKLFPPGKDKKLYEICNKFGYPAWITISMILVARELIKSLRYIHFRHIK